jgi:hypothetical protein
MVCPTLELLPFVNEFTAQESRISDLRFSSFIQLAKNGWQLSQKDGCRMKKNEANPV